MPSQNETQSKFIAGQVTRGNWRPATIPASVVGLPRDLEVYFAKRTSDFITIQRDNGDPETFCPPVLSDLAISSGPCGFGCRGCCLLNTFRSQRDPWRPVVYENVDLAWDQCRDWLADPLRRPQDTFGLGIDKCDSLLFEGVFPHARTLIPMFADPAQNPTGNELILLTKSRNVDYLDGLPTERIAVAFSLNPEPIADLWEGKYADTLERITPPISERLHACRQVQQFGFRIRWRIDPILHPPGWQNLYEVFFREAAALGIKPQLITLGTYREIRSGLDHWRGYWGLPPMEWRPATMAKDGTHRRESGDEPPCGLSHGPRSVPAVLSRQCREGVQGDPRRTSAVRLVPELLQLHGYGVCLHAPRIRDSAASMMFCFHTFLLAGQSAAKSSLRRCRSARASSRSRHARRFFWIRRRTMSQTTSIGWCDHTWNPWWGCTKVSDECRHCYIQINMRRRGLEPFGGPMRTSAATWQAPLRWNKIAAETGVRHLVFTCSISDFFHPGADPWRPEAWGMISECSSLDWLVLTKRPELVAERLPADWGAGYANVWLGVTAGCSASLKRLELLRQIPAKLKWVSAEPLLEPLNLRPYLSWLAWVVTGCESAGRDKRRLMDIAWVRDLDEQCREFGVPHYFKQRYVNNQGRPSHQPLLDGHIVQDFPAPACSEPLAAGSAMTSGSQPSEAPRVGRQSTSPPDQADRNPRRPSEAANVGRQDFANTGADVAHHFDGGKYA